jgi:flavin reductase (DIM6/NTAB) family NADH-FMN oxidoreductase RutF
VTGATGTPPDAPSFRRLMSRWATGVAVVTSHDAGGDAGLTVNALLSLSLVPPSLLISLSREADTTAVIERSRAFVVNFLEARQRPLSERFAQTTSSEEKFRGLALHRGVTGGAILDGTLGAAECRLVDSTPRSDHVLLLGEVVRAETGSPALPLLYYWSGYAEPSGSNGLRLPPPRE